MPSPAKANLFVVSLFLIGVPGPAAAQDTTAASPPIGVTDTGTPNAPDKQSNLPQTEVPDTAAPARLWSLGFTAANVYDDNIDHDDRSVNAYGFVYGTEFHYQTDRRRPLLQMDYELARYIYPGADRWSRLSHYLRTSVEKRLTRRLSVEGLGEVVSGGVSEEQEISNSLIFTPRLDYRLPRGHRVRFYGAYRLRRYSSNTLRNATNRYLGLELQQRLDSGDTWEIGYRYEDNDALGPRYSYLRTTYETGYSTMVTLRDMITFNVKYRSRRYRSRTTEVDDIDVPRHDQRWIPSLSWVHRFSPRLELQMGYALDTQSSNDLDEDYSAHSTG
ncbi:MAG: hypothetical protein ACRD1Q_13580, partial [Vicinamibacterales bacterium]